MEKIIILASQNQGKLLEFQKMFQTSPYTIVSAADYFSDLNFLAASEKFDSYEANAKAKCFALYEALLAQGKELACLADDSGLEVDFLAGKPAVFSARYAEAIPGMSQDVLNRNKLLEAMSTAENRKAQFVCQLVYKSSAKELLAFGCCRGKIAEQEIGEKGFGYDPIFIADANAPRTMAELDEAEKNSISHRALAVQDLLQKL